ncbi:uncharacterized protein [Rutidosis leptorrhynchoides]|uniref:uncharacterized protein n=1 Tax=Rutidosis leptorrhynchoides TaxID=125765 RepID=UPI003A991156
MVSTRRSGSIPNNNERTSSSPEHKPPSPKRQKLPNVDNGCASEKSTPKEQSQPPLVENSKELSSSPVLNPPENVAGGCNRNDEGEVVSGAKTDVAPATSVATPIAQG